MSFPLENISLYCVSVRNLKDFLYVIFPSGKIRLAQNNKKKKSQFENVYISC